MHKAFESFKIDKKIPPLMIPDQTAPKRDHVKSFLDLYVEIVRGEILVFC